MIGIIDYGMGNLCSVEHAVHAIGAECIISSDLATLRTCDKWILPGVGSFRACMNNIHAYGLYEGILDWCKADRPLLGICLGMQMLYESSMEDGYTEGFGLLKGKVVHMDAPGLSIPEIGWNPLEWQQDLLGLSTRLPKDTCVYYVHSWYASSIDETELYADSTYGPYRIPGMVGRGHVLGTQFHPEKSGKAGLEILRTFVEEFE